MLQLNAWNDDLWQLAMAQRVVAAKIRSAAAAARHYQRQGKKEAGDGLVQSFERAAASAENAKSVEELRGIEGSAAAKWYEALGKWLPREWKFDGRNRRPPRDPINALLSLGYMQLYRRVVARIEAAGYESSLGALHEFRSGRMSLACDLMEPMRIPAVDRWVIAMVRQGIVQQDHFEPVKRDVGVRLKLERIQTVLGRFDEHWHRIMMPHIVDDAVCDLRESLREKIGGSTGRLQTALKNRIILAASRREPVVGSGKTQPYEP